MCFKCQGGGCNPCKTTVLPQNRGCQGGNCNSTKNVSCFGNQCKPCGDDDIFEQGSTGAAPGIEEDAGAAPGEDEEGAGAAPNGCKGGGCCNKGGKPANQQAASAPAGGGGGAQSNIFGMIANMMFGLGLNI